MKYQPQQNLGNSMPILVVVATLFAMSAFGAAAFAQSADSGNTPDATQIFGEEVDVRVVNLEVVVTRKGERITGLDSDDFTLLVDGVETPIEFFTEVHGGTAVGASGTASALPAFEPGELVGTRYLVFVDDVYSLPNRRNRILRRLKEDLPRLGPQDSMAIVAYDGSSIELLTTWTNSDRELARVIDKAQDRPAYGLRQQSRQRFDQDFWYASASRFERRIGYAGYYRPGTYNISDLDGVIDAASASLRAFARPEGRKVMLLLSGGWPPSRSDWGNFDRNTGYGGLLTDRNLFSPLIDTANRLGYTLYPVDVPGTESRIADASYGNLAEAELARDTAELREWYQEGALVEIATETGGKALLDGASFRPLQKVSEDTRSYYSIGFTPNWQANDARHEVKVEVAGKNKVRTRRSFSDLSRRTETTLRLESAQLFDLPIPSAGNIKVAVGETRDGGFRKVIVPILVEIPLDQVTHLPSGEGWATQLELRVAVTDDRGDRADIPVIPIVLERETEPEAGDVEIYEAQLKMRERDHRVLVSLFDTTSGKELSERLDVSFDDI